MDLHVYRNSQDRWHDLRTAAREHGAILAINAVTFQELVERLTPGLKTASTGQRLVLIQQAIDETVRAVHDGAISPAVTDRRYSIQGLARYAYDATAELKGAQVRSFELRGAGAVVMARLLEKYDEKLRESGLVDPQDLRMRAASRVIERAAPWLQKFDRVVFHALYDLTEAEFQLARSLIEVLPDGGVVVL